MLWGKWRMTAQIVVYCELLDFEMLKTTTIKSDSGPNGLINSCSACLFKQTSNIHLHRLLPDNLHTNSKFMWFSLKGCFQKVHVMSPMMICYLHMIFDVFLLERCCAELHSVTLHQAI